MAETYSAKTVGNMLDALHAKNVEIAELQREITALQIAKDNLELRLYEMHALEAGTPYPEQAY